jgi:hypothetical protein
LRGWGQEGGGRVDGKGGGGGGGRNDPSLYAHMNNKRKKKKYLLLLISKEPNKYVTNECGFFFSLLKQVSLKNINYTHLKFAKQ